MLLKCRTLHGVRNDVPRFFLDRQHIVLKHHHDRSHDAVLVAKYLLLCSSEHGYLIIQPAICQEIRLLLVSVLGSVEYPDGSVIIHGCRIKANVLLHHSAVLVMHMAKIFVFARRRIAHSHTDRTCVSAVTVVTAHTVIQIISAIIPPHNIWRVHILQLRVCRILARPVCNALASPACQIFYRRGVHHIILHTERVTALLIVRSIMINPVAPYMRLAVRYVLIQRQEGIVNLPVHISSPSCIIFSVSLKQQIPNMIRVIYRHVGFSYLQVYLIKLF